MMVSVDMQDGIVFLENIDHILVIGKPLTQRVMRHRHHLLARTVAFGEFLVEPNDVFFLHGPVAHLHVRAGRITYKYIITRLNDEAVVFPKVRNSLASAFRPVGLVVARNEEIGHPQRLEFVVYVLQLGVGTHIGHVAGDDHKVIIRFIHTLDSLRKILIRRRAGRDVRIGKHRYTQRIAHLYLRPKSQTHK